MIVQQFPLSEMNGVIDIRTHGRGGQGVVATVEMISMSVLSEGQFSRSFAFYGSEMRGAPLSSFVSIGPECSITRGKVKKPDHIIVLDEKLPFSLDITDGLKKEGTITYNFSGEIDKAYCLLGKPKISKLGIIDATEISLNTLGRPLPNTCMLGAFAMVTGILQLASINDAMNQKFGGEIAEKNIVSAERGYKEVEIKDLAGGYDD